MKSFIITLATAVVVFCDSAAYAQSRDQAQVEELIARDKEWTAAEVVGDRAAVADIIGDDYIQTEENGTVKNKEQYLQDVKPPSDAYSFTESADDYRVKLYGDVAIMTHRGLVSEKINGEPGNFQLRVTHVWVKRGPTWQLVAQHLSRVGSG